MNEDAKGIDAHREHRRCIACGKKVFGVHIQATPRIKMLSLFRLHEHLKFHIINLRHICNFVKKCFIFGVGNLIRINISKMLKKLERLSGKKLTMKQIAEVSGCDPSTLSRLINHPEIVPSATVIDKLAQFFFTAFSERSVDNKKKQVFRGWKERKLMDGVVRDLVTIYPDEASFWESLPSELREDPNSTSLDAVWSVYERIVDSQFRDKFSDPLTGEAMQSLGEKLKTIQRQGETKQVDLTLSWEEFELLSDHFPAFASHLVEGNAKSPDRKRGKTK